ncbi:hypothetical protein AcW1_004924 [Taiwanofungus camphoratus]|nr:hypothetical protein AcW1_004924 [Antrodia cinnamomea]
MPGDCASAGGRKGNQDDLLADASACRKQEAQSRRDHHPFELALAGTTYDGHVGHPAPLAIGSPARVQSLSDPGASSVRSAATPAERDPPVNRRPSDSNRTKPRPRRRIPPGRIRDEQAASTRGGSAGAARACGRPCQGLSGRASHKKPGPSMCRAHVLRAACSQPSVP